MKVKKTVTDKVIAANRGNATKSTGPRSEAAVRDNAGKHRLLAKNLAFQNEEERADYDRLALDLEDEYNPRGRTELALVEEIAVCFWKLRLLNAWDMEALTNRRNAAQAIVRALAENYAEEQLPLFTRDDGSRSAARLGWDCQELVIRTGTRSSEHEEMNRDDKSDKSGHVQVEAKLNTSMDSILRYGAMVKRDLYRAIGALRKIQRERQDQNGSAGLDKTNFFEREAHPCPR
jgi:hypothetical protein